MQDNEEKTAALRGPRSDGAAASAAVEAAPDGRIGTVLDGRYHLQRRLGVGGMGAVYEALDERLGGQVAVKCIDKVLGLEPAMQARFFREVAAMVRVRHPNVVRVTDRGFDGDGRPYFVMELLDGSPLNRLFAEGVGLPAARVAAIAEQLLRGVHAIHEMGLIHRDLKPPNVMADESDVGGLVVKIVDFGIAKALDVEERVEHATKTGMFMGTPGYAAPETYSATRAEPHPRQDVYAVGVILFEMLAGGSAFGTKSMKSVLEAQGIPIDGLRASSVRADVPEWLDKLVAKATVIDYRRRFQSAQEMLAALLEGVSGQEAADDKAAETADLTALATGTRVGQYEVVERRGEGGMGIVYAAIDTVLKRRVALKFMRPDDEADSLARARFEQEGVAAAQIDHPNVVRVHYAGRWGRHPFLVLELVDGPRLRARWQQMDWPAFRDVICQMGAALDACHARGIVHRDVTPENILVAESGRATLVDFGIARAEGSNLTRVSAAEMLGRYGYKPLEQAMDPQSVKPPADEWALGAVVYEALTGRPPYVEPEDAPGDFDTSFARLSTGAPPRPAADLNPSVNRRLSDVLGRALAVQPAERFPTTAEFVTALVGAGGSPTLAVAGGGDAAGASNAVETARVKTGARAPGRWLLAGGVLVIALGGVTLGRWYAARPEVSSPVASVDAGSSGAGALPSPPDATPLAAAAPPPSAASAADTGATVAPAALVTLHIEGKPAKATALVDGERVTLPTDIERPAGTVVKLVVEAPGYHHQDLVLNFDATGVRKYVLRPSPKSAPASAAPDEDESILVKPSNDGK